jgi:hypothetical protein
VYGEVEWRDKWERLKALGVPPVGEERGVDTAELNKNRGRGSRSDSCVVS